MDLSACPWVGWVLPRASLPRGAIVSAAESQPVRQLGRYDSLPPDDAPSAYRTPVLLSMPTGRRSENKAAWTVHQPPAAQAAAGSTARGPPRRKQIIYPPTVQDPP